MAPKAGMLLETTRISITRLKRDKDAVSRETF